MKKILLLIVTCHSFEGYTQYWSALPQDFTNGGGVYTMAKYNNEIIVAGSFADVGNLPASNIARWNGTTWNTLGPGLSSEVYTMVEFGGSLYAGGLFQSSGNHTLNFVARWNGTTWFPVGNGFDGIVYSLCVFNGSLYAGGDFYWSGTDTVNHIARWDGNRWVQVGEGLNDIVISMDVYRNELIAGGKFYSSGNTPLSHIAKWNGSSWSSLGSGTDAPVLAMVVNDTSLYAGGWFSFAGNVPSNLVARWDGYSWDSLSTGLAWGYSGWGVQGLCSYQNKVYAAGEFYTPAGASNLARWDGNSWIGLGTGADAPSFSFLPDDSVIYAGGYFNFVNNNIAANCIAKWKDSCSVAPLTPVVIQGPSTVCEGSTYSYYTEPVNGASSYLWSIPTGWTGSSSLHYIVITPSSQSGTISVKAVNSCGTSSEKILYIAVNSLPAQPGPINGMDTICMGSSYTYTVQPVAGATRYFWNIPFGWAGSSTTNSITVIPGSTNGLVSVRAYNDCGLGLASFKQVTAVSHLTLPPPITGESNVCTGNIYFYSIPPVQGANQYVWTLPAGWIGSSNTNTILVTAGASAGEIVVRAGNACGDVSPPAKSVQVQAAPGTLHTINGPVTVCEGSTVSYSTNEIPGALYEWSFPTNWMGYSQSNTINILAGSSGGEIRVKALNPCGSTSEIVLPVSLIPYPVLGRIIHGDQYAQIGETRSYRIDSGMYLTSYSWNIESGGKIQSGQGTPNVDIHWEQAGQHYLSVYGFNACKKTDTSRILVEVDPKDLQNPYNINVFPNPFTSDFTISARRIPDQKIHIDVYNSSGQLVTRRLSPVTGVVYLEKMDLGRSAPGVYVLKIKIGEKWFLRKLVKIN